jgi:hypothetical protein
MLKQLLFSNPVFHDGINVTVRKGYKWADAMGEVVDVMNTDGTGEPIMAHVLGVLTTQLDKIPESILMHEHDPECRTLRGITKVMREVYGDEVKDDEPVTVLFFEFGEGATFEVEDVDVRVEIDVDFTDEEFALAATMAHEQDITLNQFIQQTLERFMEEHRDGESND